MPDYLLENTNLIFTAIEPVLLYSFVLIYYIYMVFLLCPVSPYTKNCSQNLYKVFFKTGNTKVGKNLHQTYGVLPLWYTCAQPYYLCSMAATDTRFSLFRPDQHVIAINTWANIVAMPGVCTAIFLQHVYGRWICVL